MYGTPYGRYVAHTNQLYGVEYVGLWRRRQRRGIDPIIFRLLAAGCKVRLLVFFWWFDEVVGFMYKCVGR
ncbi:predicted protein [Sclerotinia sclerotiorum 1980 UF-70]|uniref:Uncharacterized protein n=1 Tax=Sclerotinia sclerotiorum (strain ATCC 18683 / 1980 / Ss-1) TaxID=665079 RepID=A7EG83_SCLS1|nr:predicted protein [Sclerotinia sclerotiorum 1980 UF-70]EDO01849.1 predicted protein [Sclerotinia sclerotiorum 1980 UF-70]